MSAGQVILVIVSGLGIFHGLFLALLLWSGNNSSSISNRVLGVLMLILSVRVGKSVILAFTVNMPMLYVYLGLCLMLFVGPLYLIYSRALLKKAASIRTKDLLHFVPGVMFMLLAIPMAEIGFRAIPDYIAAIQFVVLYLHFLGYILFVRQKVIKPAETTPEIKTWLTILFYGLLAIWLEYVLNLFEEEVPYILGPIVYSITVYTVTYLAFRYKYLTLVNMVKYQTAGVSGTETANLFDSIENLMQSENLFLDPNLTLSTLGKRLRVSTQKLSMTVNSQSGSNFNEYVNKYRIAHAQRILNDPTHAHLNIAAIAYECGFNSLSTFNSAFKKITGKTPSQVRNRND